MNGRLTEIGNASQFHEYLSTMGIHSNPPLDMIKESWEYRRDDEIVALVKRERSGQTRYYLNAHRLCRH
ncbi:hypothetical protein [Aeromonas simiae]|uniref:Uncharacterized protein n=1 Tax=Aeromonas simiae TaxID=218936 RepID=A0A5J6X1W7_9GAMM|nr:hypothetical protein [Aeromonas simiae]MDO2949776.1 hypothetical protein [Aeromonas simiae]MDO2953559.1 hypothetical protein [Aeromonas simiae]MDO2957076.1 hypothetical protein [Aeromonas simiae]QFI56521.1 hypothetical protein FE240_18710 [Aeromonas simiae]